MTELRVWILFEPEIYGDLFKRLFQGIDFIEIVDSQPDNLTASLEDGNKQSKANLVVLSLNENGQPEESLLPYPIQDAKFVAFSPDGNIGYKRLPGQKNWQELRPFGLAHLMYEVLNY